MTDKAYAVPLHEQLASVPRYARLIIDDADGMGTRFIPVGRMCHEAAEALRARLEQPEPEELGEIVPADEEQLKRIAKLIEPEPVAYLCENAVGHKYFRWKKPPSTYKPIALYTAPPQREWQGLTDEEIREFEIWLDNDEEEHGWNPPENIVKYLEANLKEKNT